MTEEKWYDILSRIEEKYEIEERGEDEDPQTFTKIERVIFTGPVGKIKIERVSHPKRINTKTMYSKRAGVASAMQDEYDMNDIIQSMHVYRWDEAEDDWLPVHADSFL